ncbi:MAG: hypothetical protein KF686_15730 [Ramlibacter sp.]|nr:hypothetical protein [Ramlibacter sp.]
MPRKITLADFKKSKQLRKPAQRSRAVAQALDAGADVLPHTQVLQGSDAAATPSNAEIAPVAPPATRRVSGRTPRG